MISGDMVQALWALSHFSITLKYITAMYALALRYNYKFLIISGRV